MSQRNKRDLKIAFLLGLLTGIRYLLAGAAHFFGLYAVVVDGVHDAVIGPGRANARSLTHGYCQKLVPFPLPPAPGFPFSPGLVPVPARIIVLIRQKLTGVDGE